MKRLMLDDDQARMLANWLRMAASKMDEQERHLRSCGHSFASGARIVREEAVRARTLAERLCAGPPLA